MKFKIYFLLSIIILMVGCASNPSVVYSSKWEKLGQTTVNYRLDKDVINVTARQGSFNAINLVFQGGAMNMHRCVVHYRNGDQQKVNLKGQFRGGDETRVIDLDGGNRVISKVVFWYDTKNLARKKSTVNLWGRH